MPPRLKRGKREEEEEEEERERKKEPRRPTRRTRGDDECEVERTRHWKVGLVGDTHGMFDESLRNALGGVDEIWHTGDIAGRCGSLASAEAVLKPLRDIAPVTACVRGNTDAFAGGLLGHRGHSEARASSEYGKTFPEVASVDFPNGGHTAVLTHICAPPNGCDKPSQDALVVRVTKDGGMGDKRSPPVLSVPPHLSGTGSFGSAMAASAARRGVSIVVCGHSHVPGISHHKGVLWINPGSAGPRRFKLPRTCALLELCENEVSARILRLDPS